MKYFSLSFSPKMHLHFRAIGPLDRLEQQQRYGFDQRRCALPGAGSVACKIILVWRWSKSVWADRCKRAARARQSVLWTDERKRAAVLLVVSLVFLFLFIYFYGSFVYFFIFIFYSLLSRSGNKFFRTPEFFVQHLKNKHVRDISMFNNYVKTAQRPLYPTSEGESVKKPPFWIFFGLLTFHFFILLSFAKCQRPPIARVESSDAGCSATSSSARAALWRCGCAWRAQVANRLTKWRRGERERERKKRTI